MKKRHTKGIWKVTTSGNAVIAEFPKEICKLNTQLEEKEANAKIIAAAPDLLAALEAMKIHFHTWLKQSPETIGYKHASEAVAAIKKATE